MLASRPLRAAWRGSGCARPPLPRRRLTVDAAPPSWVDAFASNPLPLPPLDAVFVLGGGLRDDGSLPPWVQRRLDVAAGLRRTATVAVAPATVPPPTGLPPIVLLGAGTPHKPPPTDAITGRPLTEGTAGARYLVSTHGVPPGAVLKESQSYDTVGNALFGLTTHVAPRGWRSLAVVTSSFHMGRTRAIFDTTFGLGGEALSPAASSSFFSLHYVAVSDAGIVDDDALAARAAREAASTAAWREATDALPSLAALHAWVFDTHLCYATGRQDEFGTASNAGVDPKVLETY